MGGALATLVRRPGRQFCSLAAELDQFDHSCILGRGQSSSIAHHDDSDVISSSLPSSASSSAAAASQNDWCTRHAACWSTNKAITRIFIPGGVLPSLPSLSFRFSPPHFFFPLFPAPCIHFLTYLLTPSFAGQRRTAMRSASAALLEVPKSRTAIGDRSFIIAGPRV